jgi:hypothetical protein
MENLQHHNIHDIRSIKWKLNLGLIKKDAIMATIKKDRLHYATLVQKYTVDSNKNEDLEIHNPLSLSDQSVWKYKFEDQELKREIGQDVCRTLPELQLFREQYVRDLIGNVLFIWSKENPDISYRQGMHELVAIVFLVINNDLKEYGEQYKELFVQENIELDTMALFFGLMNDMKVWYRVGRDVPILKTSIKIFELLHQTDKDLFEHLQTLNVEPQLFAIRWVRLLFLREFPIDHVLECWDAILTKGLDMVEWISVAMLVHIRNECKLRLM